MIELDIPGRGALRLEHVVFDVNGTLARDGRLLDRMPKLVGALRDRLTVHLLTADTYGRQAALDAQLGLTAVRLQPGDEAGQKAAYVRQLDAARVIAIGHSAGGHLAVQVHVCYDKVPVHAVGWHYPFVAVGSDRGIADFDRRRPVLPCPDFGGGKSVAVDRRCPVDGGDGIHQAAGVFAH